MDNSFVMCDELKQMQVREKDFQTRLDKANNVFGKLKPVWKYKHINTIQYNSHLVYANIQDKIVQWRVTESVVLMQWCQRSGYRNETSAAV